MAANRQPDYVGLDIAIRIDGLAYRAQRVRVHLHGEAGDLTSGEDLSKRRKGTVPDFEVTITKASFDDSANQNIFAAPRGYKLFDTIDNLAIFPGGVDEDPQFTFTDAMIDDFDMDTDANMLSPLSFHCVCSNGETPDDWYPDDE